MAQLNVGDIAPDFTVAVNAVEAVVAVSVLKALGVSSVLSED